jgi:tRNA A58 N-methylase Trm61
MGIGNMKMEKIVKGGSINLHFGFFSHDSIIGQPYGSKIKSVSKTQKDTYIYVLKPTPSIVT